MELQDSLKLEVVIAIFYKLSPDGGSPLIFLQQRTNLNKFEWEFPGGKVELGENHIQALHREIKEELGVDLTQFQDNHFQLLGKFQYKYPELTVNLNSYLIQSNLDKIINSTWFSLDQVGNDDFPLIKGSRNIITELKKYFK